ncbi:MAG: methylated-DNA--[protein]-cysteine S-methyltransferase [Candidatus Nanopelagicaceae bacterium]
MPLFATTIETPIGGLNLIADGSILLAANLSNLRAAKASLHPDYADLKIESVKKIPIISDLINDYFDGDLQAINGIKVAQPGGVFSQSAWKAMRKVKGTISYAQLAARAGSAAAVRAAGSACAKNAIVLVVPCHRIIKTGGNLGNYAYGLSKKEWLLRHEGAL